MAVNRKATRALIGVVIGVALAYFTVRKVSLDSLRSVVIRVDPRWIAASVFLYLIDLGLRTLRWWVLLANFALVRRTAVAEALFVGYALNNVLPARLGELFRADYLGNRINHRRSAILGSIVIERLLDGISVVLMFYLGFILLRSSTADARLLSGAAASGASIFAIAGVFVIAVGRYGDRILINLPEVLRKPLSSMTVGLKILPARALGPVLSLNVMIWLVEMAVIWATMRSLGVELSPPQAAVLTAVAALSTLVPTAPGFLGSYQYVFSLCMDLFGLPRVEGIVGATLVQIFLFGTVVSIGLVIYMLRNLARLREMAHE